MTTADQAYGGWLNLLGSGLEEDETLHDALARLHDEAEASHRVLEDAS